MGVKNRSGKYLTFIIYMAVIVLINLAGLTLFFRADLTESKIYSLSEVSREVVSTLSEPLTIKVFFTRDLPAPHNNTERYLRDLLEEYGIYANTYFNYRFYDMSPDEGETNPEARENREMAEGYGIHPVQIQVVDRDEVKFQRAYMGLVLIHGDIIERLPTISSTEGLEYALTTAIQKLNNKVSALLGLPDKIHVKLFLSSSLEVVAPFMQLGGLSELPKRLEKMVDHLNQKNYGKLEFEYLDPSKDERLEDAAKKYNLLNLKWPALSEGKIPPGKGMAGLVMEYGQKVEEIPVIQVLRIPLLGTRYQIANLDQMEERMNDNLESLLDIHEGLGYLADHGTFPLGDASPSGRNEEAVSAFQILASQNYSVKPVSLREGPIPESFNCLVIARPTETFSDYELYQLDQFLMRGKSLAVFLDAFLEKMPDRNAMAYGQGPTYEPLSTGLEKLLNHYGMEIKESYVLDENCFTQRIPAQMGGGEQAIYFAPIIQNPFINHDLAFMKNIKGLVTLKVSPLQVKTDLVEKSGLKAHRVFSSSEKSWEMNGRIYLNPMVIHPPRERDEQRSMPLAYLLEGEFPSYFAGRPIPEKETAEKKSGDPSEEQTADPGQKKTEEEKPSVDLSKIEGQGAFLAKGKPGRIFLMASSAMIQDNLLDERGRSPNAAFIMNVLDSLNNREGIAVMRSKEQRFNPLRETGAGTRTFVKTMNIAAPPLLVVLFGLFVWFRRHARKKRIQMMFQKQ